nr:MAG TPA: HNH endonuclease [Caudoviricetes sp.]
MASENLDLHHIISRNARPDLYYTESNLVWLSRSCHMKAHKQL